MDSPAIVRAKRLRDVLAFETSRAFSDRERAALRFFEQVTRAWRLLPQGFSAV
jgi:alkylhydroperoxidase family enzyme